MKLFYKPGTCALAPHIVLEWIGVPYELIQVDTRSEDYLQLNPLGMVPALQDGSPRIMTQADAILRYLAAKFPEANLGAEQDLMSNFDLDEVMAFLTGDLHPAFWPVFSPERYTTNRDEVSIEASRQAAFPRVDRVMQHLNSILDNNPFVGGNRRSIADPYAFAMVRWSSHFEKSWQDYPSIKRFMEEMFKDDGVNSALIAEQVDSA